MRNLTRRWPAIGTRRLATGLLAWMTLGAAAASGQGAEFRGRVVNDSGAAVANATVSLTSIRYSVRTDSAGVFRLTGTPGSTLGIAISAPGYRDDTASVVLPRGRAVTREFVLVSEAAALPEANPSDRVLRGRIHDPEGQPIGYANVQLNGGRRVMADDSGRFTMPITVGGAFSLLIRRIGFTVADVAFDVMPDTSIRIEMQPLALALPESRVTGSAPFLSLDLNGFYRRLKDVERGINHGYFVTPEDLEFRKPLHITAAVEQFPNIRIRPGNAEQTFSAELGPRNLPAARNLRIEDRGGCPLTVYVNRVRVTPRLTNGILKDEQVNAIIQPNSVAGIEVYPRMLGAPPEFQSITGTCGVVLIWTK